MNDKTRKTRQAVFLDRDGTIIEDNGYLNDISQVQFFDETVDSLVKLQQHFDLFIVTNQSGVARGIITNQDVERINNYVLSYLTNAGVKIVDTYVCPHLSSDQCDCIKPKPYFLLKAEKEHNIDLRGSFVIGDHPHDLEFAQGVGATGIYVLTGHGEKHKQQVPKETIFASGIKQAAMIILSKKCEH